MYAKLALCTLLLHLLILLFQDSCDGAGQKKTGGDVDIHIEQVHPHSHHMNMMDPSLIVFFFLDDLKLGNTIPIYFPKRELSDSLPHLLSKEEADSIPFSLQQLPHLLRLFSFSHDSPQAKAMEETLQECERNPIKGETKICATSSESMHQFLRSIFGSDTPIESLSTTHLKRSDDDDDARVHKYAIKGVEEIRAPKMVACHTMPYAYTVLYCHHQDSESRVYRVSLTASAAETETETNINGDEVEAIAVCHMDTSHWGSTHVAFKMLGVEPGSTPVCHFFPADNFVWVPTMSHIQTS